MGVARGSAEVTEIVTPHRCDRECDEDAGRFEGRQTDGAFIFPGDCKGFIDPDKFDLEVWKPIAEKAGLAGTRFHDLRHFFASQLIAQGETAA
jgi:integrase